VHTCTLYKNMAKWLGEFDVLFKDLFEPPTGVVFRKHNMLSRFMYFHVLDTLFFSPTG